MSMLPFFAFNQMSFKLDTRASFQTSGIGVPFWFFRIRKVFRFLASLREKAEHACFSLVDLGIHRKNIGPEIDKFY